MENKLFYTIGEVAKRFQVNESLIRFWEQEFDEVNPQRNKKGNRLFTAKDVAWLEKIYHLVKEQGYTLQGAKECLRIKPVQEGESKQVIAEKLRNIKVLLLELREQC